MRNRIYKMARSIGICVIFSIPILGLPLAFTSAQVRFFNSGSTGANGAFPPGVVPDGTTAITLNLNDGVVTFLPGSTTATLLNTPADGFQDGILHFTAFDVPTGVTLSFVRNPLNTPVTILAQNDVNIRGTIIVSGENGGNAGSGIDGISGIGGLGGPGGFRGGNGEKLSSSPGAGDGLGPGGGVRGGEIGVDSDGGSGGGFGTAGGRDSHNRTPGGGTYGTMSLLPLVGGSGGGGRT